MTVRPYQMKKKTPIVTHMGHILGTSTSDIDPPDSNCRDLLMLILEAFGKQIDRNR